MSTLEDGSVFKLLPLGSVKPKGWLLRQLRIQADGLSGNLDKFWPDIRESSWIGGKADGWERLPYWLDGFIPLAWLLDNAEMKDRADRYMSYIMDHIKEDGWLCPDTGKERNQYDLWALFLMLKVLSIYYEASGNERALEVIRRALLNLDSHLNSTRLFAWGKFRWFECLIPILTLFQKTGEQWIIRLALKLRQQGFDWQGFFRDWPCIEPNRNWTQHTHVVNNAMMLKSGPLMYRINRSTVDRDSAENMMKLLEQYHGMVTGIFTGDECLAGRSPVQGTELCAVAEFMYSLEHTLAVTGKATWGDRLERVAYNALPATFSPDMWTHQYDQQVNQIQAAIMEHRPFYTNGPSANIFGLEPNYGCCTANLSQPWPKFASSLIMQAQDGIAIAAYAPCSASLEVEDVKVSVEVDTEYPFRDCVEITIDPQNPVSFTLYIRVPEWADCALLEIGEKCICLPCGEFYPLKQTWEGTTLLSLYFPMRVKTISRPGNLWAIVRGPLVYSLRIGERWEMQDPDRPYKQYPHCDYQVFPETPWNYGLLVDPIQPDAWIRFEEMPISDLPFSPEGSPVRAYVKGKKIRWGIKNGSACHVPDDMKPIPGPGEPRGAEEELVLIPYGCTNLRMTEMPFLPHTK